VPLQAIGTDIPLFELGLNSLHALAIRSNLEELLNIKLSVSLIYDYNTIQLLSKHLEDLINKNAVAADKMEHQAADDVEDDAEEALLQILQQELNRSKP